MLVESVWIKRPGFTLSSPTLTYSEPNGDRAFSCHLAKIELRVFRRRTSPPGNELPVLAGMNVFSEFRRLPVTDVLLLLLPSAGPVQGTGDSGESLRTVYYCIPTALVDSFFSFFLFFFFVHLEINALPCILEERWLIPTRLLSGASENETISKCNNAKDCFLLENLGILYFYVFVEC